MDSWSDRYGTRSTVSAVSARVMRAIESRQSSLLSKDGTNSLSFHTKGNICRPTQSTHCNRRTRKD
jgi:hypothetical protein